jgi:hypothetical protein
MHPGLLQACPKILHDRKFAWFILVIAVSQDKHPTVQENEIAAKWWE